MKKTIYTCLLLLLTAGCAHQTANQIAGIPERPRISQQYQALLMKAGPETAKEAQKHEWAWLGWADKMEMRVGH